MNPQKQAHFVQRSFRLCQQCGRPTPHHTPACVNCGARSLRTVVAESRVRAAQQFLQAFFARVTPAAYVICLINLALFLLMTTQAESGLLSLFLYGFDGQTLLAFGAKSNEALRQGEWFRFLTPAFLTTSGLDLLTTLLALSIIGPQVERLFGSARFVLLYLLAGVGAVLGSVVGHGMQGAEETVTGAASGAMFGLLGVLAVFCYQYRSELPTGFRRSLLIAVLPAILINLFLGVVVPNVENSAQVGGLLAGTALTLLISYQPPGRERFSPHGLALILVCTAAVAYGFSRAYEQSSRYLHASQPTQTQAQAQAQTKTNNDH